MRLRRRVLGDAHVDRTERLQTPFDAAFQQLVTEWPWGTLWSGEQLDARTRSLVTIALLGALGHLGELELHVKAARNTGASPEEIGEALLHVAVYAGVPAANRAFAAAKSAIEAADREAELRP